MAARILLPLVSGIVLCASVHAQKVPDARIDTGTLPGAFDSIVPQLAISGDTVLSVWREARTLVGNSWAGDVYFNRSLDRGATWGAAETRVSVGTFPQGLTLHCSHPYFASASDRLFVCWTANPVGSALPSDVYFNRSLDLGVTWLPQSIRIDTGTPPYGSSALTHHLAASGDSVYVIWIDSRPDNPGLYFNRSTDAGLTWLATPPRIDTAAAPSDGSSDFPEIACSDAVVAITWRGRIATSPNHWAAFVNVSQDHGTTWFPQPVRLNTNPTGTSSAGITSCVEGDRIFVAWTDHNFTTQQQWCSLNRSLDAGLTWLNSPARVSSPAALAYDPQVTSAGGAVHIAWKDYRASPTDIYFNRSLDAGQTWQSADTRLDVVTSVGDGSSWQHRIAASGSDVYATWLHYEDATGDKSVFLNRSNDRGATWLAEAVRMNQNGGLGICNVPTLAASNHGAYVAWCDERNGAPNDIYFNIPSGAIAFGQGSAGSGAITPVLTVKGASSIGSSVVCSIENALGAAPAMISIGFHGQAPFTTSCPNWLVARPTWSLPVPLSGPAGVPGVGKGARTLAIPSSMSLLGMRWTLQGRVLDPAGMCGYATTPGVDLWIL